MLSNNSTSQVLCPYMPQTQNQVFVCSGMNCPCWEQIPCCSVMGEFRTYEHDTLDREACQEKHEVKSCRMCTECWGGCKRRF